MSKLRLILLVVKKKPLKIIDDDNSDEEKSDEEKSDEEKSVEEKSDEDLAEPYVIMELI